MLKPAKFREDSYVYREGEKVRRVYFLYNGLSGFVIKEYDDLVYALIR